jgi:transposase InsO family protein
MRTTSFGGAKYFLTFIDDFSRKVWVYSLRLKSEVLERFKEWKALVENQSGHKVKVLRSDNGGEYTSKAFDEFLRTHGIARNTSAPYTPQQNGVAERANRTLVEMGRSMLYAQGLQRELWAEAVQTAAYTRNRCPTRAVKGMTPEEAWSGKRPHISHMRVFGCLAYAKVPDQTRCKGHQMLVPRVLRGHQGV